MTREEAKKQAMRTVFVSYSRGKIEEECRKRGIPVPNNRGQMEKALIEAMTDELAKEDKPDE